MEKFWGKNFRPGLSP